VRADWSRRHNELVRVRDAEELGLESEGGGGAGEDTGEVSIGGIEEGGGLVRWGFRACHVCAVEDFGKGG
jgi:hypothetical protein